MCWGGRSTSYQWRNRRRVAAPQGISPAPARHLCHVSRRRSLTPWDRLTVVRWTLHRHAPSHGGHARMLPPVVMLKSLLGGAVLTLASGVASTVFAWQHGWAPALGHRSCKLARCPCITHSRFGSGPGGGRGRHPGISSSRPWRVGACSCSSEASPCAARTAPQDGVARWATTADLEDAGLFALWGVVVGWWGMCAGAA